MWYENLKHTFGLGIISFVLVKPNRAPLTSTYFCWWNINCRKGIASTSWINTIGIEKFSGGLDNNKTSYTVTSTKLIILSAWLQYMIYKGYLRNVKSWIWWTKVIGIIINLLILMAFRFLVYDYNSSIFSINEVPIVNA